MSTIATRFRLVSLAAFLCVWCAVTAGAADARPAIDTLGASSAPSHTDRVVTVVQHASSTATVAVWLAAAALTLIVAQLATSVVRGRRGPGLVQG
jgi:hypothetical protein